MTYPIAIENSSMLCTEITIICHQQNTEKRKHLSQLRQFMIRITPPYDNNTYWPQHIAIVQKMYNTGSRHVPQLTDCIHLTMRSKFDASPLFGSAMSKVNFGNSYVLKST